MADSKVDEVRVIAYPTICGPCVRQTHWEMLTGYCITGRCHNCCNYSDLAIVKRTAPVEAETKK